MKFSLKLLIIFIISLQIKSFLNDKNSLNEINQMSQLNQISPPTFNKEISDPQVDLQYKTLLSQIEEKRKLLNNLYNNNNNQNLVENFDQNNYQSTQSTQNNQNNLSNSSIDYKMNTLIENIQNISKENEKLKPLLKTIVDMQFYTFQKVKQYQKAIDEIKTKVGLQNNNKKNLRKNDKDNEIEDLTQFNSTFTTNENSNLNKNSKNIKINEDLDDDELTSLLEKDSKLKKLKQTSNEFLDP